MLISKTLEKIEQMTAAENMANRLADKVRNIWLEYKQAGYDQWEENFYEDPDGVSFLRSESFPQLQGIDYIFKWWGNEDLDGLAGELEVLWKVQKDAGVEIFKSWIRLAPRDFVLGTIQEEQRKREINREEFRRAFAEWQELYVKQAAQSVKNP